MKKFTCIAVFLLIAVQPVFSQNESKGSFEFSFLGSEFVDQSSFGFSIGANKNWHEYFQIGFSLQSSFNRQQDRFGYLIGSPYYTATAFTLNNTAQLYTIGNFSVEANANIGWLRIDLQDEDFVDFNPVFGVFEPETIASENFRLLQGGITLNYVVSKKTHTNIAIFLRTLRNQSFGNVRFGGQDANSSFQFSLGVKLIAL